MEIFAEVFLFVELGGVLCIFNGAKRELIAEIGRRGGIVNAAGTVLPRAVEVPFSTQYDVVSAGRAPFDKVESGKQLDWLEVVAYVCAEQVPVWCDIVLLELPYLHSAGALEGRASRQ